MDRVERITSIINLMASSKSPWRVTELGSELKIDKSSISRILSSLEKKRWVKKLANDEYMLGDRILELSLSVLSGIEIKRVSLPYLYELNNHTGETVGLAVLMDFEDMIIDQVESQNSVRHVLQMGVRYPLWSGATGKVILANMEGSEIEAICSDFKNSGDLVLASGVKLTVEKLKEELAIIKKQGYAISLGERTPITSGVAAPIFERNKVKGAVLVTGPLPRFDEKVAVKYSRFVIQSAHNISIRLGSNP